VAARGAGWGAPEGAVPVKQAWRTKELSPLQSVSTNQQAMAASMLIICTLPRGPSFSAKLAITSSESPMISRFVQFCSCW